MSGGRRLAVVVTLLAALGSRADADGLEIGDGVVVKFGGSGELIVRDGLTVNGQVIFTSAKDDARGGPLTSTPGTAQPGDWLGVRLERSSPAAQVQLEGLQLLFGGAGRPAFTLRRTAITLSGFSVSQSGSVAVGATSASTSILRNVVLSQNPVGFQADLGARVRLESSVIASNASFGAVNLDPGHQIPAQGLWWGHPGGPLDSSDDRSSGGLYNPDGLGNPVSDRVVYSPFAPVVPLFGLRLRPVEGSVIADPTTTFALSGPTAVAARLSEDSTFAGVPFQPMGSGTRTLTLSTGDGLKTVYAEFQAPTGNTSVIQAQVRLDAAGPTVAVNNPTANQVLARPMTVAVDASDPAGVERVEFYVDNVLVATDRTNAYSYDWDVRTTGNGPHVLSVVAVDNVGRRTRRDVDVVVSAAPPPAPVITAPANGFQTTQPSLAVTGTAERGVTVTVYAAGVLAGRVNTTTSTAWSLPAVALIEGESSIHATASDVVGSSGPSAAVTVRRDTGAPPPPGITEPRHLPDGRKRFEWLSPPVLDIASYSLYRATGPFTARAGATRIQSGITTLWAIDNPPSEGTFFYAVTARDAAGNESEISRVVQVTVDRTLPRASVTASPSGVVGLGPVTLTLVVSEAVAEDPFLSVTPQGASPVPVSLSATGAPLTWSGVFTVTPETATGTAALAFAAKDLAGNRGTQITSGGTIVLDTRGPQGTIAVTPARPLGPGTHQANLTLDEPAAGTPVLRFLPPSGSPVSLSPTGSGASWQAPLTITATMGDGPGGFELQATDDLGNTSSGVVQGAAVDIDNTPPAAPVGLAASTRPAGQVDLTWTLASGVTYNVYRAPAGQPFGAALTTGLAAGALSDTPSADGEYLYAVTAVDAAGNESGRSSTVSAGSDRTPPGNPTALILALDGDAIRASWTPPSANPADTYRLYRATDPITSIDGLTPVQTNLVASTALDRPSADGAYDYAVVAVDAAGNVSGLAGAGPIGYDQAAPVITVEGVTDGQVSKAPLTIQFSATDFNLASVTATLDGVPFTSGGTLSSEGDHTLVVNAEDDVRSSTRRVSFAIDTTVPSVLVEGVTPGTRYNAAVTPVITVADPRLVESKTIITLNGAPFQSGTAVSADADYTLAVHAEDRGGNVRDVSVAFTIDAPPPPVQTLNIDIAESGSPVLSWTPRPEADVTGYIVSRDEVRLTPSPVAGTTFTDTTFDPFAAHVYGVQAVDAAGHEGAPRTATLTSASLSLTPVVLTRRYFDRIEVVVQNRGSVPLIGPLSLQLTLKDGGTVLATRTISSGTLAPGASATLYGVFSTGTGTAAIRTLDAALTLPGGAGARVRRLQTFTFDVREPSRHIEIFNDPVVLGGAARVTLKVLNHGSAPMDVKTSQGGGPTPDVEVLVKDKEGNVLGSARLDDRSASVITTAGYAFAEIGPGGSYLAKPVNVPVPSSAPNDLVVEAVVRATHSEITSPSDVVGPELAASTTAQAGTVPYLAVAAVTPSLYDEGLPVTITGHAYDVASRAKVPAVPVKIGISTRGFDRFLQATTNADGEFTAVFMPMPGEAGAYTVWATHPAIVERSAQATFDILGLRLSPNGFNLRLSQGDTFPIDVTFKNTGERPLSGFAYEVTGGQGITGSVDSGGLALLSPGQTAKVRLTVNAAANAELTNFALLKVTTGEGAARTFDVGIALFPAAPALETEPSFTEIGVGNGALVTRTVRVKNVGFAPLVDAVLDVPTTSWISLGVGPALPAIPVGGHLDIPVTFLPPANLTPGIYSDRFVIRSGNHVPYTQNLFATVTSSTKGRAAFEVRNSENVLLPNASVWIQNLQVASLTVSKTTDTAGLAVFDDLPSGPYQYRIQANGTETTTGKFDVQPDQVTPIAVVMPVNYVTFEWSVTPVIFEDRYDFTLKTTFNTSVPAPVLMAEPAHFNIRLVPGGTYVGEYKVTNRGLVALDDISVRNVSSPRVILETLVESIPRLRAMESITVPFRVTLLPRAEAPVAPAPAPADGDGAAMISRALARAEMGEPDGSSVAAMSAGGGAGATSGGGDENLCDPTEAYTIYGGVYVCIVGISFNQSTTVDMSIMDELAKDLGLCDSKCNLCDCLSGKAAAACKCLTGLASGDPKALCDCLSAAGQEDASKVCGCELSDDPCACIEDEGEDKAWCECLHGSGLGRIEACLKAIGLEGAAGAASSAGNAWNWGKCGIALAKCFCGAVPSACDPGYTAPRGGGGCLDCRVRRGYSSPAMPEVWWPRDWCTVPQ